MQYKLLHFRIPIKENEFIMLCGLLALRINLMSQQLNWWKGTCLIISIFCSSGMDIIFLVTRTSFAMNKKKSRKCLKKSGIMTIQERWHIIHMHSRWTVKLISLPYCIYTRILSEEKRILYLFKIPRSDWSQISLTWLKRWICLVWIYNQTMQ